MNLTMFTASVDGSTTGTMKAGDLLFYTIELPWRNNQPNVSCVPAGEYQLLPYFSPTHGQTWRLHNPALKVWGASAMAPEGMRSECELHSANWARQLLGCIALGIEGQPMFDPATGIVEPAVERSVDAINELRQLLDGTSEEDMLTIIREGV